MKITPSHWPKVAYIVYPAVIRVEGDQVISLNTRDPEVGFIDSLAILAQWAFTTFIAYEDVVNYVLQPYSDALFQRTPNSEELQKLRLHIAINYCDYYACHCRKTGDRAQHANICLFDYDRIVDSFQSYLLPSSVSFERK